MLKSASHLENEFVVMHPPLIIQGEFSLQEARKNWQETKQPVVLLDLPELRRTHRISLQTLPHEKAYIESPEPPQLFELPVEPILENLSSPELSALREEEEETKKGQGVEISPATFERGEQGVITHKPTFSLTLPTLTFPSISFPTFTLPRLFLPIPSLSHLQLHRLLNLGSHFFLGTAVALLLLFAGPILILESRPLISQAIEQWQPFFVKPTAQAPNTALPSPTPTFEPSITSPEDVFSISIPDLEITSAIIANVDPNDSKAYSAALKKGIAHALGTGLPDQTELNKTIYLFAHSTDAPWNILRYNAQFYALKDAQPGQKIHLTFWGKDYTYTIENIHIIESQDTSYLQVQTEKEQLILQTCYPPGTSQKRLILIATPSAEME